MTIHIARDYNPATSGYQGSGGQHPTYASFMYNIAIFLHKVLGYSIVGSWGFNIDSPARTFTITAAGSTGNPTITTNGNHLLNNGDWVQITGATGNTSINGLFQVQVVSATQVQLMVCGSGGTYNANSATLFAGFLYANGASGGATGAGINVAGAPSVYTVSIPPTIRGVTGTDSGRVLALKSTSYPTKNSGVFKISSIAQGQTTTIAAGSNNQPLPQGTINVISTTGFPASGTIYIQTGTAGGPLQVITYTGGGGGGTQFTGCSGGSGTLLTGQQVSNFNGYTVDYRSTDTPPPETNTLAWWLYEVETQVANYIGTWTILTTSVQAASNTTPIVITSLNTSFPVTVGSLISITGVGGNTAANGIWNIVPLTNTTWQLVNSVGNGNYTSGGTIAFPNVYSAQGSNLSSKIILQSPHATGWQLRICVEPVFAGMNVVSIAVGYNGNSQADFPTGGTTSLVAEYFNFQPSGGYVNTSVGGGASGNVSRVSIVGDDGGQSFFCYTRLTSGGGNNGLLLAGIPDNEPVPNYPNTDRPFVYGSLNTGDYGTIQLKFNQGGVIANGGFTFRSGLPEMCALASWANMDGTSGTNPFYSANAGDSPFTGSTEVIPVEVWGGTTTDPSLNIPQPTGGSVGYFFDQRFMGTAPFLRYGRTNFGTFTQSTDNTTTLSVQTTSGSGVSPIQVTTTATNALTSGQTVVISGVVGNTAANGTFVITVINNTTFTLNGTTGNGTYVSGGTVNGTPHWIHLQNGIYLLWNGCAGLNP